MKYHNMWHLKQKLKEHGMENFTMNEAFRHLYVDKRMSLREVAERFGVAVNTVRNHLMEQEVNLRPRSMKKGERRA